VGTTDFTDYTDCNSLYDKILISFFGSEIRSRFFTQPARNVLKTRMLSLKSRDSKVALTHGPERPEGGRRPSTQETAGK